MCGLFHSHVTGSRGFRTRDGDKRNEEGRRWRGEDKQKEFIAYNGWHAPEHPRANREIQTASLVLFL